MKIKHSFPIFINSNSKILILGSFPSVKSRELDFYYMHKQNRFYKILSNLFNEDFYNVDIITKKEFSDTQIKKNGTVKSTISYQRKNYFNDKTKETVTWT